MQPIVFGAKILSTPSVTEKDDSHLHLQRQLTAKPLKNVQPHDSSFQNP
jgi:hypothetical protein